MENKIKKRILYNKIFIPIESFDKLEKKIMYKRINTKYHKFKTNLTYFRYFAGKFVYKKKCHITSFFKENILFNDFEEFIRVNYTGEEACKNLIRYSLIYKEYVEFYCFPIISDFYYNKIIVDNRESKAEIFYDINYADDKQKNDFSKDNGVIIYSKRRNTNESESKNEIIKSIFNQKIRKQIELYSPNKIECSKVKKEEDSHFISSSNENALNQLMNELNQKQKNRNNNTNNLKPNNINSNRILSKTKIEFNNNNLVKIQKLNQLYKKYKENIGISTQRSNFNNKNNKNKIHSYFINNDFHKVNNFIKSTKFNYFSKTKNDKNSMNSVKNKSVVNINNDSLLRSISVNKATINSVDYKTKIEKQKNTRKTIYSLKNKFSSNLKKKEIKTKTPNKSFIIKLNKVIKINNNIININIIKNKKEKSIVMNQNRNLNYSLINNNRKQNNKEKINNINDIIDIKSFNTNRIYSRNKHNSKSSKYSSGGKINYNNKIIKDYSNNSRSKPKKIKYNSKMNNNIIRKIILQPKINMFYKSNNISKHIINNEIFIKSLNLSSINSYRTHKKNSERVFNIKRKINCE